ncbi:MAG: spore coat protein [Limnochordales bacterium]|nr:hypothetical protein [Bacillota bacterium]
MDNQAGTFRLTDRDILTDLLLTAKQLIGAYGLAERESTHPQLRSTLHQLANEEEQYHAQAFQAMHQRGWYETPLADSSLAQQIVALWSSKLQAYGPYGAQQTAGQIPFAQPYAPQYTQQNPGYNQPYNQPYGH